MLLESQAGVRGLQPNDGAGNCSIVVGSVLTLLEGPSTGAKPSLEVASA